MLEELIPLDPVHFFAFQVDCHYVKSKRLEKKHLLPDLSEFHDATPFAEVSIGWHERGVHLLVLVSGRFDQPDFPNFQAADSIELFFDTRDVKTTGYTTRFCHHFYFLPDPFQTNGDFIRAGEITRFRTDDVHELCDASQLRVEASQEEKGRLVNIFIPSECLCGYDPAQFDRLGFTYRINRISGVRQNFSASDADFPIESQPSLWASLKLIGAKT
jgi:hypothetical protein